MHCRSLQPRTINWYKQKNRNRKTRLSKTYQGFLCPTKKEKKGNNKIINIEDSEGHDFQFVLQPLFFSDYFFSELKYFKVKVKQKEESRRKRRWELEKQIGKVQHHFHHSISKDHHTVSKLRVVLSLRSPSTYTVRNMLN